MKIRNKKLYKSLLNSEENGVAKYADSNVVKQVMPDIKSNTASDYKSAVASSMAKTFAPDSKGSSMASNTMSNFMRHSRYTGNALEHIQSKVDKISHPKSASVSSGVSHSASSAMPYQAKQSAYADTKKRNDEAFNASRGLKNEAYQMKRPNITDDEAYLATHRRHDDVEDEAINLYKNQHERGKNYMHQLAYLGMKSPKLYQRYLDGDDLTSSEQSALGQLSSVAGYVSDSDGNLHQAHDDALSKDDIKFIKHFLKQNPKHVSNGKMFRATNYANARRAWKKHSRSYRAGYALGWKLYGLMHSGKSIKQSRPVKAVHNIKQGIHNSIASHRANAFMNSLSTDGLRYSMPDIIQHHDNQDYVNQIELANDARREDTQAISGIVNSTVDRGKRNDNRDAVDTLVINARKYVQDHDDLQPNNLSQKQVDKLEDHALRHHDNDLAKTMDKDYPKLSQKWYDSRVTDLADHDTKQNEEVAHRLDEQHPKLAKKLDNHNQQVNAQHERTKQEKATKARSQHQQETDMKR